MLDVGAPTAPFRVPLSSFQPLSWSDNLFFVPTQVVADDIVLTLASREHWGSDRGKSSSYTVPMLFADTAMTVELDLQFRRPPSAHSLDTLDP
jgi:hypothetical protein